MDLDDKLQATTVTTQTVTQATQPQITNESDLPQQESMNNSNSATALRERLMKRTIAMQSREARNSGEPAPGTQMKHAQSILQDETSPPVQKATAQQTLRDMRHYATKVNKSVYLEAMDAPPAYGFHLPGEEPIVHATRAQNVQQGDRSDNFTMGVCLGISGGLTLAYIAYGAYRLLTRRPPVVE